MNAGFAPPAPRARRARPSSDQGVATELKAHCSMKASWSGLALSFARRRIRGAEGLTSRIRAGLGELPVGHLEQALHLGAHAPFGVDQAAGAVGQPLRLADLLHAVAERLAEELEYAAEAAAPVGSSSASRRRLDLGAGQLDFGRVDRGEGLRSSDCCEADMTNSSIGSVRNRTSMPRRRKISRFGLFLIEARSGPPR